MKNVKRIFSPLILQAVALAAPGVVLAQPSLVPGNIVGINNIVLVIQAAIRLILIIAFVAAFILLLVGGLRWILAGGDEKGVAGARATITAALIGLIIVLVAYAIIRVVEVFFNVSIITGGIVIPTVGS